MRTPRAIACAVFAVLAATARIAEAQAGVPACPGGSEKRPDVPQLIKRVDQLLSGRSSVGVMTMSIKTPLWSRSLNA